MPTTATPVEAICVEGKSKILSPQPDGTLHVTFKDEATAFNGQKHADIPGKGALNAWFTEQLLSLLEKHDVPTCLESKGPTPNTLIYKPLHMLPIEVIVRNVAFGSLAKRLDITDGTPFVTPVVEYCLKSDATNDPVIDAQLIQHLKLLPDNVCLKEIESWAREINCIFCAYFDTLGIQCADFKIELGLESGLNTNGRLVVGDELSPDNFRLRDLKSGQILDKDVFRLDKGDLIETYTQLKTRFEKQLPTVFTADVATYTATVTVSPRADILSPESKAILNGLHRQGFDAVNTLQAGKQVVFTLDAPTLAQAREQVDTIAKDILANPVVEDVNWTVTL